MTPQTPPDFWFVPFPYWEFYYRNPKTWFVISARSLGNEKTRCFFVKINYKKSRYYQTEKAALRYIFNQCKALLPKEEAEYIKDKYLRAKLKSI